MNNNPRNPPEHSGDCAYYPIPSTSVGHLDRTGKTAAVVGAGPGGLTAALTIKEEGYENVIVFEQRSVFSRGNVVNLHPESLHIFERLNIMDRFLERASLIIDHRNHVFANGMELFNFRDQGYGVDVNPEHSFDVDDVINGFRNETLYSISLADLQDLLATIACERGIKIVSPAHARLVPGRDGIHSVWAAVGDSQASAVIDAPDLILIAEGAKGEVCGTLGGKYSERESLRADESWVFGNYKCDPDYAFSHLLFEFRGDCEHLTISNCIFLPLRKEVNVAVTVGNPDIPGCTSKTSSLPRPRRYWMSPESAAPRTGSSGTPITPSASPQKLLIVATSAGTSSCWVTRWVQTPRSPRSEARSRRPPTLTRFAT
jgi:hypothetical protein